MTESDAATNPYRHALLQCIGIRIILGLPSTVPRVSIAVMFCSYVPTA
jgi:hypothetical protein